MATADLFVTLNDGISWVPLLEFSLADLSLTRLREAVLAAAGLQGSARRFAYQEAGMKVELISDAQLQSWVDRGEGPKQLFFISVPGAAQAEAGAGSAAAADYSEELCQQLVQPVLTSVPPFEDLDAILSCPPPVKLPVLRGVFSELMAKSPATAAHFCVADGTTEKLTIALATALSSDPIGLQQQPFVAGAVNKCFIEVLSLLDGHLPLNLQLGLKFHRDVGDSGSLMTLLSPSGVSLRPDIVIRDRDDIRLLFKAEEKDQSHKISVPIEELCSKTSVWSPLYYGQLTYLLTMAVAGACMQFCAIKRGSPATPKLIGPPLQMDNIVSRAHIIIATFNLHRLLAIVAANLPASVLPVDKDVVLRHTNWGYTRTLHFMSTELLVHKRIKPWSKYVAAWHVDFAHLKDVYSRTACAAGLVHAAGDTPTLDARDDKYTVALHPLGLQGSDAVPLNERELQHAAHGLLHGLQALHEANFVHRDLRLANCACDISKTRFFLLDLETCAPADAEVTSIHMSHWSKDTLCRGLYRPASDLHELGRMLSGTAAAATVDASGQSFLALLKTPAARQTQQAAELLRHPWISCSGTGCTELALNQMRSDSAGVRCEVAALSSSSSIWRLGAAACMVPRMHGAPAGSCLSSMLHMSSESSFTICEYHRRVACQ
eukprot:TRINITY_DN2595_c0_g1_i2.p1 TRINITY_DN2595_c0_g1~~TRINITY_DN2595_c0_g1_i2.p1  ORF type:complete len:661 (+),score=107.01 TRINITY_DN2595_c0_g1_i2:195-2177(+)